MDGFVCSSPTSQPPHPCHRCLLPRRGEDTRVRAHNMCAHARVPLPLPPPGLGGTSRACAPSPFPSLDCLSEYRKNKLCRWPPASQKHLMSRSAQAALRGCVNLEEFPAWELPLGVLGHPPLKLCPPRGGMLPAIPGGASCPAAATLAPLGGVFLLFTPVCKRFGVRGSCSAGNLPQSLRLRMMKNCWG